MKRLPVDELAKRLHPFLVEQGYDVASGPSALAVAELLRERAPTLKKIAEMARYCYVAPTVDAALLAQHLPDGNRPAVAWVAEQLTMAEWSKPALAAILKEAQAKFSLKTPQVMMPLRVLLTGSAQAPGVDALLVTLGREVSLARLKM